MLGRRRDWIRWLALATTAVGLVRLAMHLLLPGMPQLFAWSGALTLGLALVFLLLPLPHEALLAHEPLPKQHPDRPGTE